ncbi:MAG TPA: bifunctional nuclease family protein [Bacteroidales bacterium]|nr:bifunctional nuclease family protein [Bacteroidales bacterium]HRZ50258.1 bifunctional nuclease family protein [Bacteroidales bacterium]
MQKIPLAVVAVSGSKSQTGSYALFLDEIGGNRRIPVIIGAYEAQSIVLELEQIKPPRPVTHDLFKTLALAHGITVREVTISRLANGIFYAEIHTEDAAGNEKVIDARTSDAVAIALRFKCPLFTYESVISAANIVPREDVDPEEDSGIEAAGHTDTPEGLKGLSSEQLLTMLDDAVAREDYELASRIRDEINQRKVSDG